MKYAFDGNHITVTAQTSQENHELLQLLASGAKEPNSPKQLVVKKTRHTFRKECPKCKKLVKGRRGLGIHLWKTHGISRADRLKAQEALNGQVEEA